MAVATMVVSGEPRNFLDVRGLLSGFSGAQFNDSRGQSKQHEIQVTSGEGGGGR